MTHLIVYGSFITSRSYKISVLCYFLNLTRTTYTSSINIMVVEVNVQRQGILGVQGAMAFLATIQLNQYQKQICVFDGESFDYIVVGGGTAGCVVASRLVEDKKTSVLLIEAGNDPAIDSDMAGLVLYLAAGETWKHQVEDPGLTVQHSLNKPHVDVVVGKVLGGSSSVNFLQYASGSKHDYNEWAQIVNDTIWNWENVLPYLKKSQRLEVANTVESDKDFYGLNGKVGITSYENTVNIDSKPYFKIHEEAGHNIVPRINGNISLGVTSGLYIMSKGRRQNTALTYLSPQINNTNLYILKDTTVIKIIFDANKRAVGVKASICNKRTVIIKAKIEIIISAGIVNTPKLLMISGVGLKEHLCKHKIKTISDLPVGEGLISQPGVTIFLNMTNTVTPYRPMNAFLYPVVNLMCYVSMNKSNDYPDYQAGFFITQPKFFMESCIIPFNYKDSICNNIFETSVNSHTIFLTILKQRFKSRGKILLRSNDFKDDPIIYSGIHSVKDDIESHAEIVMDYFKVKDTKTFKELGGQIKDPGLTKCGKMNTNNIKYWECYVQYMTGTHHKYCGTCAMGSVVDSHLRVYGVKNLRVVDASVIPNLPLGGTLGPTIIMAERAADIIKKDRYV